MHPRPRPNPDAIPGRGLPSEAGFSLIEGLMAAALLLVVAIAVLPLFMRALESNVRGGRASEVSALATGELEMINQATVDRDDWQLTGGGVDVRQTGTRFWDLGKLATGGTPALIGDEKWIDPADTAAGPILWTRQLDVRKYSFADVHTSITVGDVDLATLGDPRWFDSPLTTELDGDLNNAHITEFRVHIREDRDGKPAVYTYPSSTTTVWMGQRMTIGHFRTY